MISRNANAAKALKCINLILDPAEDGDMIEHLYEQGDVYEYLKALIRKDMAASADPDRA
ncbi:MAG: hypothetical protein K6F61_06495 [Clostridiales bacterium]|nr:hypothetical protein [Clostridiales bacterium]